MTKLKHITEEAIIFMKKQNYTQEQKIIFLDGVIFAQKYDILNIVYSEDLRAEAIKWAKNYGMTKYHNFCKFFNLSEEDLQ